MNFEEQLAAAIQGAVVVVGIGNPMRGDDAAGSLVARGIADFPGVSVIDAEDVPEDYAALVIKQRPDTIVLIDGMDMDSAPGSVALLDSGQIAEYSPSTHRVPISMLMSIFEHETHARVYAIGIQPAHIEFLHPMSNAVATTVEQVAGILNRVLAASRARAHGVSA